MQFKTIAFFCLVCLMSCTLISKLEKKVLQNDTIIDFTKVDVSPSFAICDKLIDEAKTNCFRANIHQQMTKKMRKFSFVTPRIVDETITVILLIDNTGQVSVQEVKSSDFIKTEIPNLRHYIETSITDLPKLSPAIKRGIPVATQYKLPIKIKIE